jgi:hypothetical protein
VLYVLFTLARALGRANDVWLRRFRKHNNAATNNIEPHPAKQVRAHHNTPLVSIPCFSPSDLICSSCRPAVDRSLTVRLDVDAEIGSVTQETADHVRVVHVARMKAQGPTIPLQSRTSAAGACVSGKPANTSPDPRHPLWL